MAKTGIYNLCVNQGATFGPISIQLVHTIAVIDPAPVQSTILKIAPVASSYLAGHTFDFNGLSVTLAAELNQGDRTMSVAPLTVRIPSGSTADGNPINLTSQQARSKVKQNYADTSSLAVLSAIITDPLNGIIQIGADAAVTTDIPANIEPLDFYQLMDWPTKSDLSRDERKLFLPGFRPYVWDLETFTTQATPQVKRRLNGLVAVTAEVTT
ncbi:MAG: hypothetical protein AAGF93_00545 [Cyanobacteria bacterium P01_H01_bin.105]